MISNAERRAIMKGESAVTPRVCDVFAALAAVTGKIELVYEGEQEGVANVSKGLLGKAIKQIFLKYFPEPYAAIKKGQNPYAGVVAWFKNDRRLDVSDSMSNEEYAKALQRVDGLRDVVKKFLPAELISSPGELAVGMEFLLESLHQNSMLSKDEVDNVRTYSDMINKMFSTINRSEDEGEGDEYA
jgi:magnesium chelatase subunit I